MALRTVRLDDDPILKKVSKPVREITPRISDLIDDMFDTMADENGVGLAAVQVGVLRRIFVLDIDDKKLLFINPEIISKDGVQVGMEGCLSLPNQYGVVARPHRVGVRAFDREMKEFELELEGLGARAICHENDHLNGRLYSEQALIMNDEIDKLNEEDLFDEYCEEKRKELLG